MQETLALQPKFSSSEWWDLWNFDIRTDSVISIHRPEIVVHNCIERSVLVLNVTISADFNIIYCWERVRENFKASGSLFETTANLESSNDQVC